MARILAIDTDLKFRQSISHYLESTGYSVDEVETGRQGLDVFLRFQPDLVLLGLSSEGSQDARNTLTELVERYAETPVIVLSGSGDVAPAVEMLRLGAWDYLSRPIPEAEVLVHSIERAIEQARLQRENDRHFTQLKTANRKLQLALEDATRARLAAEQANMARSEFVSGISNEIRTPMNGILGMAEILMDSSLTPEQSHYTRVIRESAKGLMAVFNDLLDYSRIETGSLVLDRVNFSLREMLDDLNEEMRARALSKELSYDMTHLGNIPDDLLGDPWRIRQVLANLVENAIKFTRKGGISVRVRSEVETEDFVLIKFEIADTGIGVPRDRLPTLFDGFNRIGTSTGSPTGGLGLGLALAVKLTTLMNGKVGAMSTPGEGSVFWFTVKLYRHESRRRPITPIFNRAVVSTQPESFERMRSLRVLLAEDSPENQMVAEAYFKKLGVNHTLAGDGMAVLALLEENDFDLVLMDLQMPRMNGLEATGVIRSPISAVRNHAIPIVAVTAFATEEDRRRCQRAGMNAHLPKPFSFQQLVDVIDQTIGTSQRTTTL